MQIPLQITYRDLASTPALDESIQRRAEALARVAPDLVGCRVMVEQHHHHHRKGNLFHVRLDLTVKGGELAVSREAHDDHGHEDVHVAIRDAFDAARRRLQAHEGRVRGEVKLHEVPAHGRVLHLFPHEDYGVILEASGREIYFHRNAVLSPTFEALSIGDEVRMTIHEGEQGPQASSVRRLGKHHLAPPA